MAGAVTVARMREIDRICIEEFGIPAVVLMENAGRGAAQIAESLLGSGQLATVLAGRGNNGGDGFVVARHLTNNGFPVSIFLLGEMDNLPEDSPAKINFNIARKMRIPITRLASEDSISELANKLAGSKLIVDALLGTGLSGEVREPIKSIIALINGIDVPILSLDIPSGLDGDTGKPLGVAVEADITATFGAAKCGFYKGEAVRYTGAVRVVDISIPQELLNEGRRTE